MAPPGRRPAPIPRQLPHRHSPLSPHTVAAAADGRGDPRRIHRVKSVSTALAGLASPRKCRGPASSSSFATSRRGGRGRGLVPRRLALRRSNSGGGSVCSGRGLSAPAERLLDEGDDDGDESYRSNTLHNLTRPRAGALDGSQGTSSTRTIAEEDDAPRRQDRRPLMASSPVPADATELRRTRPAAAVAGDDDGHGHGHDDTGGDELARAGDEALLFVYGPSCLEHLRSAVFALPPVSSSFADVADAYQRETFRLATALRYCCPSSSPSSPPCSPDQRRRAARLCGMTDDQLAILHPRDYCEIKWDALRRAYDLLLHEEEENKARPGTTREAEAPQEQASAPSARDTFNLFDPSEGEEDLDDGASGGTASSPLDYSYRSQDEEDPGRPAGPVHCTPAASGDGRDRTRAAPKEALPCAPQRSPTDPMEELDQLVRDARAKNSRGLSAAARVAPKGNPRSRAAAGAATSVPFDPFDLYDGGRDEDEGAGVDAGVDAGGEESLASEPRGPSNETTAAATTVFVCALPRPTPEDGAAGEGRGESAAILGGVARRARPPSGVGDGTSWNSLDRDGPLNSLALSTTESSPMAPPCHILNSAGSGSSVAESKTDGDGVDLAARSRSTSKNGRRHIGSRALEMPTDPRKGNEVHLTRGSSSDVSYLTDDLCHDSVAMEEEQLDGLDCFERSSGSSLGDHPEHEHEDKNKEQTSEGHQELDRDSYLGAGSHSIGAEDRSDEDWGSRAAAHRRVSRGAEPEGPNMSQEEADDGTPSCEPAGPHMSEERAGAENAADAALVAALAHGREDVEIDTFLRIASRFSAMNTKCGHDGSGSVATSATGASSEDLLQSSVLLCSLDDMTTTSNSNPRPPRAMENEEEEGTQPAVASTPCGEEQREEIDDKYDHAIDYFPPIKEESRAMVRFSVPEDDEPDHTTVASMEFIPCVDCIIDSVDDALHSMEQLCGSVVFSSQGSKEGTVRIGE